MKTPTKKSLKAQNRPEQSGTEQTPTVENIAASEPAPTPAPSVENIVPLAPAQTAAPKRVPLPRISLRERRKNRALPTEKVLNLLHTEAPRFWEVCEVVGKWVWITFSEKQPVEVTSQLSELGFHWNYTRQCWQHPCGTLKPYDPRREFGSYFPANQKPA